MRFVAGFLLFVACCQSMGAASLAVSGGADTFRAIGALSATGSQHSTLKGPVFPTASPGLQRSMESVLVPDRDRWPVRTEYPTVVHRRHDDQPKRDGNFHELVRYPRVAPDLHLHPRDERFAREYHQWIQRRSRESGKNSRSAYGFTAHGKVHASAVGYPNNVVPADAGAGFNPWWAFEERAIPGVGKAMVNLATGNLLVQATDVDIPERGINLSFQRTWNSQSLHDAVLDSYGQWASDDGGGPAVEGNFWTSTFDAHLTFSVDDQSRNVVSVYDSDGARYDYRFDPSEQQWIAPPGQHAVLETDQYDTTSCSFWWQKKDGTTYWFYSPTYQNIQNGTGDSCGLTTGHIGKLYEIFGRNQNNNVQLDYTFYNNDPSSDENLKTVVATHSNQQKLVLSYGPTKGGYNELLSITRPDNAKITYDYDGSGNLIEVDKPGNNAVVPTVSDWPNGAPPTGDLPEYYDLSEAGTGGVDKVCGPRATITSYAYGNPREGSCISFELNSSNQLMEWQTNAILNINPGAPDNTGFIDPNQDGAWHAFNPVSFAGYAWPLTSGSAITQMSDNEGHATNWQLDQYGRPIEIAEHFDHGWLRTTESWDSDNNLSGTIDPRGNAAVVNQSAVTYPPVWPPPVYGNCSTPSTYPSPASAYETDYAHDCNGNITMISMPSVKTDVSGKLNQTAMSTGTTARPTTTYHYDVHNNVLAVCDPVYNAAPAHLSTWGGPAVCPSLTAGQGQTVYRYYMGDTSYEPFGRMTDEITPTGYDARVTYNGCGDVGLPDSIVGNGAQAFTQLDGTPRKPTESLTYDSSCVGQLQGYNQGNGTWKLGYDQDSMNRVITRTDPDGVTSYKCYYLDGSVFWTETSHQHQIDGSSCPSAATWLGGGAPVPPAHAVSYTYDADGDQVTELHHFGGSYAPGASPSPGPAASPTLKFYDGLDRLVEVIKPHGKDDLYSANWMTRYIYDNTAIGSSTDTAVFFEKISLEAHGNLYKTQEYLPADPGAPGLQTSSVIASSVASPSQWADLKGTAYDDADHPVTNYSFAEGAVNQETLIYGQNADANFGMPIEDCIDNAEAFCKIYTYDNDGREATFQSTAPAAAPSQYATPNPSSQYRAYLYDADGHITSIAQSFGAYGPYGGSGPYYIQSYTYNADGRVTQSQDPAAGDGGAVITHQYYPDGTESQLGVSMVQLSKVSFQQADLFEYSYRPDGRLQTRVIDDGNLNHVSNPGQTSLQYQYTSAGRFSQLTEKGTGAYGGASIPSVCGSVVICKQWTNGLATTETLTNETKLSAFEFDPEGDLLGATSSAYSAAPIVWSYTVRGEMVSSPGATLPNVYANGIALPAGGSTTMSAYTVTWDDRMGIATSQERDDRPLGAGTSSLPTPYPWNEVGSWSSSYDSAGRMNSEGAAITPTTPEPTLPTNASPGPPSSAGAAYSYDAENHNLGVAQWGPNGHPMTAGGATLHWVGDQILFSTATDSNGALRVNDVKIGMDGDITPWDPGYQGITFYDRGPDGYVMGCHNAAGSYFSGIGGNYMYQGLNGGSRGGSPCTGYLGFLTSVKGLNMPVSIQWGLAAGSQTMFPQVSAAISFGLIWGATRADGYAYGAGSVQGVRTYDGVAGSWTTPDSNSGDVNEPATQKSYVWNANNPVSLADESGYEPTPVQIFKQSINGSGIMSVTLLVYAVNSDGSPVNDPDHNGMTQAWANAVTALDVSVGGYQLTIRIEFTNDPNSANTLVMFTDQAKSGPSGSGLSYPGGTFTGDTLKSGQPISMEVPATQHDNDAAWFDDIHEMIHWLSGTDNNAHVIGDLYDVFYSNYSGYLPTKYHVSQYDLQLIWDSPSAGVCCFHSAVPPP